MLDLFWQWTKGLTLQEFTSLLRCGSTVPELYIFLRETRSVSRPVPGAISWPVEFLLTKFHRKHVFADRTLCSMEAVSADVRNMVNIICWRSVLKEQTTSKWHRVSVRPRHTPPCHGASEALVHDLRGLAEDLFQELRRSRVRERFCRPLFPKVVAFALECLKKGPWCAALADKDGCFVLVDKEELHDLHLETMTRKEYRPLLSSPLLVADMAEEYCNLVRKISLKLGDQDLCRALVSGFRACKDETEWKRMFSRLQITIKSHKPPGKVTCRPIHSSVSSPLLPAYRWVALMLRPYLSSLQHLFKDSFEAFQKIRSVRLPKNVRFFRYDLVDFFLSGNHGLLTRLCTEAVEEKYRDAFAKVCRYVLENQIVAVENHETGIWKVVEGSGIGLTWSPEIANTAFDRLVECQITRSMRAKASVLLYGRYMDDGLVLGSGRGAHKRTSSRH